MKQAFLLALALLAGAAQASTSTGTIQKLGQSGVKAWFQSSGTTKDQPPCAAEKPGRFVVDISTREGEGFDSRLRYAAALGKTVLFEGTGTCSIDPAIETLKAIEVNE